MFPQYIYGNFFNYVIVFKRRYEIVILLVFLVFFEMGENKNHPHKTISIYYQLFSGNCLLNDGVVGR